MATHENCKDCLGSCEEVKNNQDKYLYKNHEEGTNIQAFARLKYLEMNGERDIVIGGIGEAEINVLRTPEESFKTLCNISERGYFTHKGRWDEKCKEIICITEAKYLISYVNNKFVSINKVTGEYYGKNI
jgi:hypothetical protein